MYRVLKIRTRELAVCDFPQSCPNEQRYSYANKSELRKVNEDLVVYRFETNIENEIYEIATKLVIERKNNIES